MQISDYPPVFQRKRCGIISDTFVVENHRREGIGEALFAQAMEWLQKKGIDSVELRVASANPVAKSFWKKNGFTPFITVMYMAQQ
ncbi:hypothetical protein CSA37_08895 [Candidatus Fermentibacteria bacterium]|nr:MAG: hypothetical protein CSA37_08895 [Candidatus Fermentibacteria bacterium]